LKGIPEHILRAVLTHAEAAITVFTADRRVIAVSDRYLQLTGYSREEALAHVAGSNLRLNPLDRDEFMELITAELSAGEADILTKSGDPLAVEYVVIPSEIDGERVFIGVMWPLVASEHELAGNDDAVVSRPAPPTRPT
jgi:PAS domain S-box-containing protein